MLRTPRRATSSVVRVTVPAPPSSVPIEDDARPIGASRDRPVLARIAHDVGDRRAKRLERGALGVGQRIVAGRPPRQRARQVVQRLAARVQVDQRIAQRHQHALDEMRDGLPSACRRDRPESCD